MSDSKRSAETPGARRRRDAQEAAEEASKNRRALWTWWLAYAALSAALILPYLKHPFGAITLAALCAFYLALLLFFGAGSRLEMLIPALILLVFTLIITPKLNSLIQPAPHRPGSTAGHQ